MKKHIKILKKKLQSYNPRLKEECGVFGISNAKAASALTALGLIILREIMQLVITDTVQLETIY